VGFSYLLEKRENVTKSETAEYAENPGWKKKKT
jgi:hypothetical protein